MDKGRQMITLYAVFIMLCVLGFLSIRWMSYRTPQTEVLVKEYPVLKGDTLLLKYNVAWEDDKYYYGVDSMSVTVSAGTFPFLEKKTVTKSFRFWHPVWNENQ